MLQVFVWFFRLPKNHLEFYRTCHQMSKLGLNVTKVYNGLGVTKSAKLAIYLVVFLSCWLCIFVFPSSDPEYHQPETFKMANLMKFGKKILHIVILVLAKIYQGLNKIAHSTHASSYNACFLVHYVHGWLNHYFETHFLTPKKVTRPLKDIF